MFMSEVDMVNKVELNELLGSSDYSIIVWELICDASISKSKQHIRLYHKANYEKGEFG
jgi:hypothetical protein